MREADTTNNRMELTAAIEGLKALKEKMRGDPLYRFAICCKRHKYNGRYAWQKTAG